MKVMPAGKGESPESQTNVSAQKFADPTACSSNAAEALKLELVLKLEIALSIVEKSDDSRGFRTGSTLNELFVA